MPVKPIIDIELNDAAFQRFLTLFNQHVAAVKQLPGQWTSVGNAATAATGAAAQGAQTTQQAAQGTAAAAGQAGISFNQITAATAAAAYQLGQASASQRNMAQSTAQQAHAWTSMARSAHTFAGRVAEATRSLLRWGALTGVISGILGGGGLFGIDRLAVAAGSARRSALGLGVTAGEQRAFDLNYGRVVDPNTFLHGVNDALTDVTKRVSLYGAGLHESDLRGKDTAQVAAELIPALKRLVDQTPSDQLEQLLTSHQLANLGLTKDDLQRIRNTPAAELADYGKNFQRDKNSLGLSDAMLKAWQDLQVQFKRSWATLESTFIRGLVGLAGPIGELSKAFTKAVGDLLSAPQLKEWIGDLAKGIQWLAEYMLTDDFHQKVLAFVKGVGDFVSAIGDAITAVEGWIKWFKDPVNNAEKAIKDGGVNGPLGDNLGSPGSPAYNQQRFGNPDGKSLFPGNNGGTWEQNSKDRESWSNWWNGLFHRESFNSGIPRGIRNNNPLNLQYASGQGAVGSDGRFGVYASAEAGIAASTRQLLLYQDRDHLDTISKIISKWAPPGENDTRSYIDQVSRGTGFSADAHLNLHDPKTTAAIMSEMIRHETGRYLSRGVVEQGVSRGLGSVNNVVTVQANATPRAVVTIHNNTGGNATVSASQLVT